MISDDVSIKDPVDEDVPWGAREAWWGVASLGLWLSATIAVASLALMLSWEIDLAVFLTLGELSLLIPVWWFVFRKYGTHWEMLGFRRLEGRMIMMGLGTLSLYYVLNIFYNALLLSMDLQGGQDLSPLFEQTQSLALIVFVGVIVAPLVEEVFFRGFLFAGFREKYGWKKAATISAVFFSFIHLQLITALPIFMLGYIFAYVYHKSNSLWLPMLLHAMINGAAFLLFGLAYFFNSLG